MARFPLPVYMGKFDPVRAGDIIDLYLDFAADVDEGDTLSAVALSVKDSAGATVPGVITAQTETEARTDFRIAVPATAGNYVVTAVLTLSDGQKVTHTADLRVV